jgi:hypothetical protein
MPIFRLPPEAETPEGKRKLFQKIKEGKLPETKEGVVLWDPFLSKPATKVKFKPDYDVKISDIFTKERSKAKGFAGGYVYNEVQGKKVKPSRVGTGFSMAMRKDMLKHPKRYIGLIAKVQAMDQHSSGALRAPSHQMIHESKNPSDQLPRYMR